MRSGSLLFRGLVSLVILLALANAAVGSVACRAVSVNALAAAAKRGALGDAGRLCGITRLTGYLVDRGDVVLIGEVDPSLPALHADDMVVAMRNVWLQYARVEGRTRYYCAPGCSIDPPAEVLQDLRKVGAKLCSGKTGEQAEACLEEWASVGSRPQDVRVLGIPFDTRFAKVMVEADYYMKRLVNGTAKLKLDGFESLSQMCADAAKQQIESGKAEASQSQSMNRFWFCPCDVTYDDAGGVTLLKSCRIQLLTEEERVLESGKRDGFGKPHPLAKRFANGFTAKFESIAEARPIYRELEALFRFMVVGKLMKDANASCSGLKYLLETYRVPPVQVDRKLPGITEVGCVKVEKQTENGKWTCTMLLPTCGGVTMDVRPRPVRQASAGKSKAATAAALGAGKSATPSLRKAVLAARKSPKSLSWDFSMPD